MTVLGRIRAFVLTIMLAAIALPGAAAGQDYITLSAGESLDGREVNLGVNKSLVVDLPWAAGDVLVSNPQIADAVLRTSERLYLFGVAPGQANVFLFDNANQQVASLTVSVQSASALAADVVFVNELLAEEITDGYVKAEAIKNSIVLRGMVASSTSAGRAEQIARQILQPAVAAETRATTSGLNTGTARTTATTQVFDDKNGSGIVNLIKIMGVEQVALKVTDAEVQREVAKQLGVNLKGNIITDAFAIGTNITGPLGSVASGAGASPLRFPFNSARTPAEIGSGYIGDDFTVQGTLQALEETQMLRTLAEPMLTAVSGETANFLAGGEFPVPVAGDDGDITIQFKPFGVNLAFTPVVLAPGRISMKVRAEVSDISATGAVSVPITSTSTVTIPATSVRRAETSIELPSGGAFVIAGLLQEDIRRAVSGLPWLQKLPILGTLFSSKDFINRQTELVMIVTAYLVKPTAPQDLARPGDNLFMANDAEAYFLNRLTKVYGTDGQVPGGAAAAQVGFTFD